MGPATRKALRHAQPLPVRRGAGLGVPGGSAQVRALQRRLHTAGESVGPIDGVYGPKTEAAVRNLQDRRGLAVDGVAGPRTYAALNRKGTTASTPPVSLNKEKKQPGHQDPGERTCAEAGCTPEPGDGNDSGGVPWWAIAIGVALVGALIAFLVTRVLLRRRPIAAWSRSDAGLELEGTSSDPSIGSFRGTAYAVDMPAWQDPRRRAEASRLLRARPEAKAAVLGRLRGRGHAAAPGAPGPSRPDCRGPGLAPGTAVLGYVTVPKPVPERQAKLYEQLAQIEGLCKRRRFELVGVVRDVEPNGDDVLERPGVRYAFEQFRAHRASALVVSDVRRLSVSRSQLDSLLARLTAENVALVALEPEVDTSTEEGREVMRQLEIVRTERTKLAEAAPSTKQRPAQRTRPGSGRITKGGGAKADALKERIVEMRDQGESLKSIAEALNEEGVPPANSSNGSGPNQRAGGGIAAGELPRPLQHFASLRGHQATRRTGSASAPGNVDMDVHGCPGRRRTTCAGTRLAGVAHKGRRGCARSGQVLAHQANRGRCRGDAAWRRSAGAEHSSGPAPPEDARCGRSGRSSGPAPPSWQPRGAVRQAASARQM